MSLNKKILALSIAAALPVPGAAIAAIGGVDLQASPIGTAVFANEITIPGTTLVDPTPLAGDDALDVKTQLGFSIVGSSKYVRLDYPGTQLSAQLTKENFRTITASPLPGTLTISQGGTTSANPADQYVIVEIAGAQLSNVDQFAFDINDSQFVAPQVSPVNTVGIKPLTKGAHQITYRLYDTATQAANPNAPGSLPLATYSGTWYDFGAGFDIRCEPAAGKKEIDVSTPAQFFGGSSNTDLIKLTADQTGVYTKDINLVSILDYLPAAAGSTFTLQGNVANILGNNVANAKLNGVNSGSITNTTAVWTSGSPALPYPGFLINLATDGNQPLLPGNYDISIAQDPSATIPLPAAPYVLKNCASLEYSGSSDRVDLVLTPYAGNKQWVRITNPSNDPGSVSITVYNDAGISESVKLSDVKVGPAPGTALPPILNKKSSTPLIDINAIYDAVQAKNPAFVVGTGVDGKSGKLRVEVRGDFGTNTIDKEDSKVISTRNTDGIYIQAVSSATTYQSH